MHNKHQGSSGNRASRDLDSITSGKKAFGSENSKLEDVISFEVVNHGELKTKDDVSFVKQLEEPILPKTFVNGLSESSLKNAVCDSGLSLDPNVTVMSFQFEHTRAPSDTMFTVKNLDFAVKTKGNESKSRPNTNPSIEENIPGAFKMLMMNKIKVNKIDEKLNYPEVTDRVTTSSAKYSNDQLSESNILNASGQQVLKQFFAKLEDNKNEVSVQRGACNPTGSERTDKKVLTATSTVNNCDTTTVCTKKTTPSCKTIKSTECTQSSDLENVKAMEQVIQGLLPLIDTSNMTINYENIGNRKFTTKGRGGSCIVSGKNDSDRSASLSFSLCNKKVTNTSKNLPDYSVLKPKIQEDKVHNLPYIIEHEPINSGEMVNMERKEIEKREISDKQIRGGQSCCQNDAKMPCNADPETYFESAHCLRFSELW